MEIIMQSENPDAEFTNLGSIGTIRPLSHQASDWIAENVDVAGWEWMAGALCAEPRCAFDICQAMHADGLTCV
jgi:hypothetical protein